MPETPQPPSDAAEPSEEERKESVAESSEEERQEPAAESSQEQKEPAATGQVDDSKLFGWLTKSRDVEGWRRIRRRLGAVILASAIVGIGCLLAFEDTRLWGVAAIPVLVVGGYVLVTLKVWALEEAEAVRKRNERSQEPDASTRLDALTGAEEQLRDRLRWQGTLRTTLTLAILADVAYGTVLAFHEKQPELGLAGALLVLFVTLQVTRTRARELEADVRQIDHERAVIEAPVEAKAETLFLKHQFELRRYYDQTLRQGALIFSVGLILLGLGAAIVITALVFISEADSELGPDLVMAGLAGIAGILTNYVAYSYLTMYTTATESVRDFHQELVQDHDLHFANLLVGQTTDEAKQEAARLEMAGRISQPRGRPPAEATQPEGNP